MIFRRRKYTVCCASASRDSRNLRKYFGMLSQCQLTLQFCICIVVSNCKSFISFWRCPNWISCDLTGTALYGQPPRGTAPTVACNDQPGHPLNWSRHREIHRSSDIYQVEDKTKFWAGTYYWTGPKFWAAGSKFWSAKSRVRLAGVTENAGRTCRKLSGIKRFFASRE